VEGDPGRGQRFKDIPYVGPRTARYTDTKIQRAKFDEVFQKLKNSFARCWNPSGIGAFIESVQYYVDWTSSPETE